MAQVRLMQRVLADNDALAAGQLEQLDKHGVYSINVMSGPGAGKTSLIERTIERLGATRRIYVIEGDIQGDLDARRVMAKGANCTQINTRGACHLDGMMLRPAFAGIDLKRVDLLIIENVGNLVCPAEFRLPAHANVTILSTPEGSDKPAKYPLMFTKSDVLVVNKIDLLEHVDFDMKALEKSVRRLKPDLPILPLSCRSGEGLKAWFDWLEARLRRNRRSRRRPGN